MPSSKLIRLKYEKGEFDWLVERGIDLDKLEAELLQEEQEQNKEQNTPKNTRKSGWSKYSRRVVFFLKPSDYERLLKLRTPSYQSVSYFVRKSVEKYLDFEDMKQAEEWKIRQQQ